MSARLALHRLDLQSLFKIKLRDLVVKHKTTFTLVLYEEATPSIGAEDERRGRVVSADLTD